MRMRQAEVDKQREAESRLEVEKMRLRQTEVEKQKEVESRLEVEKMRLRQEAVVEKQKEAEVESIVSGRPSLKSRRR